MNIMCRYDGQNSDVTVAEFTVETEGVAQLICQCGSSRISDKPPHHGQFSHRESEDAERFVNHLYDHLLNNQKVPQSVIDLLWKRVEEGKRYAKSL